MHSFYDVQLRDLLVQFCMLLSFRARFCALMPANCVQSEWKKKALAKIGIPNFKQFNQIKSVLQ